jgi:hypothetical protein
VDPVQLNFFTEIAKVGLLGVLLGGSLWLNLKQKNELHQCFQDRFADWKAATEILQVVRATIAELVSTTDQRTRAQEATARALELAVAQLQALNNQVAQNREMGRDVSAAMNQLRETVGVTLNQIRELIMSDRNK